jgi:hypothetical protein
VACPLEETTFERQETVEVGDDESLGDEKGEDGEEPEDAMGSSGFGGSAEEFGDDDDEDLRESEIEDVEFAAEFGRRVGGVGQSVDPVRIRSQNPHFWQNRPEMGHPSMKWFLLTFSLLVSVANPDSRS